MAKQNEKAEDDPSVTSMAYDFMAPKFQMIETLLGGTQAMRDAGGAYLPKHSEESAENYDERLGRTTLFNMFELTLDTLVGKPFSDPVKVNDDVPVQLKGLLDDVSLQGDSINGFSRAWFREGVAKGLAHCLVDFPAMMQEERAGRTRKDDLVENRRPYWVLIKPEDLIFASAEIKNGQEFLTHIRIKECAVERQGFIEVVKERVRVLEPGRYELWEYKQDDKRRKGKWVVVEEGQTDLDFIPLITFYTNRTSLMTAKPPLEDLAFLNIRHWQSTSDQINVLTVARFPMLAVAGATDQTGAVMAIGPRQLLGTKDPNGRFYYVEHSGKAIEAGRQDLMDLEQMMSSYGAEFLKRRPGNVTATARALDSAEAMSTLQDMATRFQDAINKALFVMAKWYKQDSGGTVDIRTDFGPDRATADRLNALLVARYGDNKRPGDLSREDFLAQLKDLQILNDDFDPRVNLMRLLVEIAAAGGDPGMVDPEDIGVQRSAPVKKVDPEDEDLD